MTLVLAPPGSGKSVFLKLLAGRVKDFGDLRVMIVTPQTLWIK